MLFDHMFVHCWIWCGSLPTNCLSVFDHFLVLALKGARCLLQKHIYSPGIYLVKVNNRNTNTRCEICSKLTLLSLLLTCRSGVFIVNFEHVSHLVLVFQFFCENVNLYCICVIYSCMAYLSVLLVYSSLYPGKALHFNLLIIEFLII